MLGFDLAGRDVVRSRRRQIAWTSGLMVSTELTRFLRSTVIRRERLRSASTSRLPVSNFARAARSQDQTKLRVDDPFGGGSQDPRNCEMLLPELRAKKHLRTILHRRKQRNSVCGNPAQIDRSGTLPSFVPPAGVIFGAANSMPFRKQVFTRDIQSAL